MMHGTINIQEYFSLIQLFSPVLQIELDLIRFSLFILHHFHIWTTRIHRWFCNFKHGIHEQNATCHPYKPVNDRSVKLCQTEFFFFHEILQVTLRLRTVNSLQSSLILYLAILQEASLPKLFIPLVSPTWADEKILHKLEAITVASLNYIQSALGQLIRFHQYITVILYNEPTNAHCAFVGSLYKITHDAQ